MKNFLLILIVFISGSIFAQKPLIPKYDFESNKWKFLDISKKEVLVLKSTTIDSALLFNEGLAPVRDSKSKMWGYIDEKGKIVIQPKYLSASCFDGGYALVFNKCGSKCYTGNEGILSDEIGYIIDKTGKIVYTDNSQDDRVYARFFLTENIGHGFFAFNRATGFGEIKSFLNYKGEILADDVTSYGSGGIFWDEEIQAVKCGLKYYKANGDLKLDLTHFQNITNYFSEGYVWSSVEADLGNDNYAYLKVLVDSTGVPIVNMDLDEFTNFTDAQNGQVTCYNTIEKVYYVYDIPTEKFSIYDGPKITNPSDLLTDEEVFGKNLGEIRLIHDAKSGIVIAVLLPSNEKYYLNPEID